MVVTAPAAAAAAMAAMAAMAGRAPTALMPRTGAPAATGATAATAISAAAVAAPGPAYRWRPDPPVRAAPADSRASGGSAEARARLGERVRLGHRPAVRKC